MHIAFVSQLVDGVLPPIQNSIGLWTYHVARRLAAEHRVTVYVKRTRSRANASAEPFAIREIISLPSRFQRLTERFAAHFAGSGRPGFASSAAGFEYACQVALDLKLRRVDVIHVHNYTQFVPIIRAFNPQATIVLHMAAEWLSQLDQRMIARRLRHVDLIIGVSEHISELVRRRFPALAERCRTVNNGFDERVFAQASAGPSDGKQHILFVGRVSQEKGVHVLLEAFAQLAPRFPNAQLDIVGFLDDLPRGLIVDLSDDPHVQALAQFYDGQGYLAHLHARIPPELSDRVVFHGGLPQAATARFYHQAAVLVNPSLSESFGMSVIEAGFCGVPAVVARTGGMKETVIDGQTGLIAEPGDVAGLARAISAMLEDAPRRRAMGQAAQARARERYTWDRIAADTLSAYQSIGKPLAERIFHAQPDQPGA